MRSAWLRRPALLASLTIIAVVLVANAIFIFGFASADPMLYFSGLGRPTQGVIDGSWTIDPNVGWTVQALGQRSVDSWLNGNVPLWNNYEGLGQPLAGEMQSAAFFLPFVLLQALPGGVLLMHIVLELVAGFGTLLFLRSLRLGWIAATVGACLFAVNGAFALMLNAPFNPIAFLPWALWGVELVAAAVRGGGACAAGSAQPAGSARPAGSGPAPGLGTAAAVGPASGSGRFGRSARWGAWVIAFSIGFMLLSGFPETALLEGLFVAVWGIARVLTLQRARVRFLLWLVAGAAGSLVIAAPALVAFVHFLDFGYTAYHGAGTGPTSYGQRQMSSLALPFAVGPVSHNPISGGQAGFLTLPAVLVGIIGFLGRRERPMRWLLSITLVLLLLNMYNFPPVNKAVQHVPGLQQILVYKYGFVLVEFIVILWAAYGVDDLRRRVVRRPVWIAAVVATFAYLVASVIYALALFDVTAVRWTVLSVTWTTLVCLAVAVLAYTRTSAPAGPHDPHTLQLPADAAVATAASAGKRSVWGGWGRGRGPGRGGWRRTGRAGIGVAVALAALVVVDAAGQFMVPQLGASPTHDVDLAPVRYLQQHQGTARFFSLGPIQPNYGSAFQLQQLNVNDLPVPQKMADLVKDNLHATWRTPLARGTSDVWGPYLLATRNYPPAKQRLILQVYGQRQSVYRSVGVAYLVMAPGVGDGLADRYGLTRVFKNRTAEIWHDPSAEPFFSTAPGSGCRVEGEGLDEVTVTCPRPTELTRRQLSSPGWTATVNGVSSPIADSDTQRFQQVQLPAGTSTVTFSYLPRGFVAASVASLLLVGLFVVDALAAGVAFVRRRRHLRPHEVASGASYSGVSG